MTTEEIFLESPLTARYHKSKLYPFQIPGFKEYNKTSPLYVEHIVNTILRYFHLTHTDILPQNRQRRLVYARQICYYFLSLETSLTLQTIGRMFGGRDHTTVIHGRDVIRDLYKNNDPVREDIKRISSLIK